MARRPETALDNSARYQYHDGPHLPTPHRSNREINVPAPDTSSLNKAKEQPQTPAQVLFGEVVKAMLRQ